MEVALSDNRLSQLRLGPPHELPTRPPCLIIVRVVAIYEDEWEDEAAYVEAVDLLIGAARRAVEDPGVESLAGLAATIQRLDDVESG